MPGWLAPPGCYPPTSTSRRPVVAPAAGSHVEARCCRWPPGSDAALWRRPPSATALRTLWQPATLPHVAARCPLSLPQWRRHCRALPPRLPPLLRHHGCGRGSLLTLPAPAFLRPQHPRRWQYRDCDRRLRGGCKRLKRWPRAALGGPCRQHRPCGYHEESDRSHRCCDWQGSAAPPHRLRCSRPQWSVCLPMAISHSRKRPRNSGAY